MRTNPLHTSSTEALLKMDSCAFRHHTIALESGYMNLPCRRELQNDQLGCAHNIDGNLTLKRSIDLLCSAEAITDEQDEKLRTVLHHSQMRVYRGDVGVNFMVYLYLMQEGTGPVCGADASSARSHEKDLRKELGMSDKARFDRGEIEAYARRSQAEASLPIRIIGELIRDLLADIQEKRGSPKAFQRKVDGVLNSFPRELLTPIAYPESSPWFQSASG